jgi:hypothetical protein
MPDQSTQPSGAQQPTPVPVEAIDTAPHAGDAALRRDAVVINGATVMVAETFPVQVTVELRATLLSECHQLRVAPPSKVVGGDIALDVYSVVDPAQACAKGERAVITRVPLNESGGKFTVSVNGVKAGEFTK